MKITIEPVSVLSRRARFARAGVVPFTIINNTTYYCFAVDAVYNQLTDFGGGVKTSESIILAALRELKEESLDYFDFTSSEDQQLFIKNSMALHDETTDGPRNHPGTVIFFCPVNVKDMDRAVAEFQARAMAQSERTENSGIVWLPSSTVQTIASSMDAAIIDGVQYPTMYERIRELIDAVKVPF